MSKLSSIPSNKLHRDERLADWVLGNRLLVIAVTIVLIALSAFGLRNLTVASDNRVFFGPDNPQLLAFDLVEESFQKTSNIFILVEAKEGKIFSKNSLSVIEELTEEAWDIPHAYRVDSVTNYQYSKAQGDELVVGSLLEFLDDDTQAAYNAIEQKALQDPLIAQRVLSLDGKVTGINVLFEYPEGSENAVQEAVGYTRQLRDKFERQYPHLDIRLTGTEMIGTAFSEAALADAETLIPSMYVIIIVLIMVLLRSITAVVVTVIAAGMSVAAALGMAGFAGIAITPLSISAPTVILSIVVAHCVHVLVTYFHQLRHGKERLQAMREALRVNIQPVFLTSLTTLVGFLSLNISDTPPINDFGNIIAAGVCYAFVLTLGLVPALVSYVPINVKVIDVENTSTLMDKLADFVIRHHTALFWIFIFTGLLFISFAPSNQINDQYSKYFDERSDFRRDSDFADKSLAGIYSIEYILESGNTDGVADPQYLATIDRFASFLREQPEVRHVAVFSDVMKRLNKNMHGDDPAFYTFPDSKPLASQYLLLFESSLPTELDLSNMLNQSRSASRVSVSLGSLGTAQYLALKNKAFEWLKDNTPEPMHFEGASMALMFTSIGFRAMSDSVEGAIVALVLISLIMLFALKSVRLGLISILPNLLPAGIGFGIWALVNGNIGLSMAPVLGITMGIVVDDTVHFMSKYRRALTELKLSQEEAVRYAFHNVGIALWVTTFALTAGFLLLSMSWFKPNNDMGIMVSMIITIALVLDFLFLPPLLLKFSGRK